MEFDVESILGKYLLKTYSEDIQAAMRLRGVVNEESATMIETAFSDYAMRMQKAYYDRDKALEEAAAERNHTQTYIEENHFLRQECLDLLNQDRKLQGKEPFKELK